MQITDVVKSKKNRDVLSVYVDNRFAFSIREEDFLALGLYEKSEITDEEIEHIKKHVIKKDAKNAAIRYLALKLHTEREVRQKLESEGYDTDTIDETISELKSMGYINDLIYAQKFLYDRSKLKPKSRRMLGYELKSRGVPDEIIQTALSEYSPDDEAVAESLLRRKFGKYDLSDEVYFKKAFAFLRHRGFDGDLVMNLLRKYKNEDI